MSEQARACAAYFKTRPGYRRILTELLKKYQRFGRPAGSVCLPDASREECEAARSFFGRSFSPPLRFQTAAFEAELQRGAFQGASLQEVLEAYFGIEIQTKKEARAGVDRRLSALLRQAAEEAEGETSLGWLRAAEETPLLRREAARAPEALGRSLSQACRGMDRLERAPGGLVRLAVLSAETSGDPHALDQGTLSGKLFLHLLAFHSGTELPKGAEQRDSLYYENGILCDSISSLVSQVGLILYKGEEEHPAHRAFRQAHEICTLSLANLSRLTGARSPSGRAYIVENEMVFTQLCDQAAQFHSPLVCTSGQPSVAALRLIDLLAAEGTALFYSGDLDGKGLSIATQLCSRHPRLLRPWHMSPQDHGLCRSDIALSPASRSLLPGCAGTALAETAEAVGRSGYAGYQELLLPLLEADLIETP